MQTNEAVKQVGLALVGRRGIERSFKLLNQGSTYLLLEVIVGEVPDRHDNPLVTRSEPIATVTVETQIISRHKLINDLVEPGAIVC